MTEYPRIDDRLGGSPPERHAERVVDEMIVWLHKNASNMLRGVPSSIQFAWAGRVASGGQWSDDMPWGLSCSRIT